MRNLLKYFGGDRVIWFLILILTIYSGLAVASSLASLAYGDGVGVVVHFIRHASFLIVGWFIIYVVHLIPYKWYSILAMLMVIVSVVLLAYTMARGVVLNDAARWLQVPGTTLRFQTSDFAKLALIIFVARYLSRNQLEILDFKKGFLPVLLWILVICGLILPENFSTAIILFTTCLILLYIGRVKLVYIGGLIGVGLISLALFMTISSFTGKETRAPTWKNRITSYFDSNPAAGDDFQSNKAKIAIANGGMLGKFAGHSTQRHSLPQAYSDFIFAIIIEEYGFVFGALPLVFLFMVLLYRAGVIVRKCDRTFPAFLAMGLMVGLVIQAMVNMGVAVGLLPVTGQPLPWISRGGTSIIFTSLTLGIILGISRSIEEEEPHALA